MTTETINPTTRVSKGAFYTRWVLSILPSLMMLMGIGFLIFKPDMVREEMAKHGYPGGTALPLTIVESVCVIIYLIPQTSVLGAILLTGYLGGATATHVRASEPFFMPVIIGIIIWLGLFLREPRLRELVPLRRDTTR